MTDSSGVTQYTYNPFGELTQSNANGNISTYTYDVMGRPLNYNNGLYNQTYTYDTLGRLLSATALGNTVTYTYDANSNLLSTSKNGEYLTRTEYNKANLPVVSRISQGTVSDEEITNYTYTPDGNLSMAMGNGTNSMYYYDGVGRLTHESTCGEEIDYSDTYTYDAFGNRTSRLHKDFLTDTIETTSYTYNSINQLLSMTDNSGTTAFTYDAVGNMLSVTKDESIIKQYAYDVFNRLSCANVNGNTAYYTYNGNNLRQSKTVNGQTIQHVYNGADIVADKTLESNTLYVRGNGLAFVQNGNTTMDYALNPMGDVSKLLHASGIAQDYTYSAYGEETGDNIHTLNPFGYRGEYTDNETGLIYLRNRYYDPSIGRFITEDPARDGLNWYAYCGNNPIRYKDPSGLVITCDEANSGRIISLLREVSGNSLEFEYKDGQINITKTYDTKHHVGQTLVSDLINSSETVNVNIGVDSSGNTNTEWPANGSDSMQIFIDPDDTTGNGLFTTYTQDTDGNVLEEVIPAYIVFGHELIHSWRDIRGLDVPSREMVGLIPQDSPQLWREEELQTMGINYTDAAGNPLRNYGSYVGIISENGLRLENGLNVRISYYGW